MNISSFFKGQTFTLEHLNTCSLYFCDPEAYRQAAYNQTNVLVLAKTPSGKVVGGFRSRTWNLTNDLDWHDQEDPASFVFSVDLGLAFYAQPNNNGHIYQIGQAPYNNYMLEGWMGGFDLWEAQDYLMVGSGTLFYNYFINVSCPDIIDTV